MSSPPESPPPEPCPDEPTNQLLVTSPAADILRLGGFVVNTQFNMLICRQCHFIVNPSRIREHIMDAHREVSPALDLQKQFDEVVRPMYPLLTYQPVHPVLPIPSILELGNPIPASSICALCHKGYAVNPNDHTKPSKSFQKHCCIKSVKTIEPRPFDISPAQRFGPNSSYFAVIITSPSAPLDGDLWLKYQLSIASRPPPSLEISIPENYRILHQFLHKERWIDHVAGLDAPTVIALVTFSGKDDVVGVLLKRVHAFLADVQSRLRSHPLRRLIGTRPSSEHAHTFQRHHQDVNYDTHQKYAFVVAASLAFLVHSVMKPCARYPFVISLPLAVRVRAFYGVLRSTSIVSGGDDYDNTAVGATSLETEPIADLDLDLDDEELDSDEYGSGSGGGFGSDQDDELISGPHIKAYPYGMSETRNTPVFTDLAQQDLVGLLEFLFTEELRDECLNSVFFRYVLLSSVKRSAVEGNMMWSAAGLITQRIAAILFTGRLVLANIVLEKKALHPEQSFASYVLS
jgi:hypothetical protein